MKSCKIKSYSIKEDKNRASTSNINVVITNLDDLDPRANSEDWQPSRIEDVEPFQIGKKGTPVHSDWKMDGGYSTKINRTRAPYKCQPTCLECLRHVRQTQAWRRKKKSHGSRSRKMIESRLHPRSELYHLASQCGYGKEINKEVENVHKLHQCQQSIDRLSDEVCDFRLLNFLDAYSGYNQIKMYPLDQEKTTFIIDTTNFCYKVMPFGLKNTKATYQRLMDKVFKKQIRRNVEVYVDNMVVKLWSFRGRKNDS